MGSSRTIPLIFRVIAATNRSLEHLVARGEFLPDLIQRLNILPINLPPLRKRREDLKGLVEFFLQEKAGGLVRMTDEALEALARYEWPGNVRELSALIDYSLALIDDKTIDLADLHPKILNTQGKNADQATNFYEDVATFESELLKKAYQRLEGNISKMALTLGIDRSHLHSKLKLYDIHQVKTRN